METVPQRVKKGTRSGNIRSKKEELQALVLLEEKGAIDLLFGDESSFNLTPCVPYGWQPVGEQRVIKSAKDHVVNLFGMLSRKGKLITYATRQNINSDFIIECLDEIALRINKPTVIVLDNASWHKANRVIERQKVWAEKNLFLFFLPTYSPHLNLVETLWRKIKYEWLKPQDYFTTDTLRNGVKINFYSLIKYFVAGRGKKSANSIAIRLFFNKV
ncbi:IS630 family transposase [uncultured Microscilla sp.]|uniref:IS630 family transposase n=1 Tax=uncultured Microscilla sp. TaxID=432653 RepID=UPI00261976A7|nr:IS630 family transposase [uncultured Microscilla sp.]